MVGGGEASGSHASHVIGAIPATKRESYLLLLASPRPNSSFALNPPAPAVPKHDRAVHPDPDPPRRGS
jgi:hypothetical protein